MKQRSGMNRVDSWLDKQSDWPVTKFNPWPVASAFIFMAGILVGVLIACLLLGMR